MVLRLSFRDAVYTSVYALAKTFLFSTALKDNHNTTVVPRIIENLRKLHCLGRRMMKKLRIGLAMAQSSAGPNNIRGYFRILEHNV